jgi:CHASE2 domain-containing sensor protein
MATNLALRYGLVSPPKCSISVGTAKTGDRTRTDVSHSLTFARCLWLAVQRIAQVSGKAKMDKRLGQLVLLAVASALLSCAALMYEQRLATLVFAGLTCTISVLAFTRRRAS